MGLSIIQDVCNVVSLSHTHMQADFTSLLSLSIRQSAHFYLALHRRPRNCLALQKCGYGASCRNVLLSKRTSLKFPMCVFHSFRTIRGPGSFWVQQRSCSLSVQYRSWFMLSGSIQKLSHSVITVKQLSFCMSAVEEMSHSYCYSKELISHCSESKRSCLSRNRGTPQWWTGQERKVWLARVHAAKRSGVHSEKGIQTCNPPGAADSLSEHTHKHTHTCTTWPSCPMSQNFLQLFCLVLFCLLICLSSHSVTALCCSLHTVWTCSALVPVKPFWNWACNTASGLSSSVTLFSFAKMALWWATCKKWDNTGDELDG